MMLITKFKSKNGTSTVYEGDGRLTDEDVSAVCQHITANHKVPYGLFRVSAYELKERPRSAVALAIDDNTPRAEKIFDDIDAAKRALRKKHFGAREYRLCGQKYWDADGYFVAPLAPVDEDFPEEKWECAWDVDYYETDEEGSVFIYVDD